MSITHVLEILVPAENRTPDRSAHSLGTIWSWRFEAGFN